MLPVSSSFTNKLNDRNRKIVKKVHLYNTKFAVPSNGISFKVYEWTDSNDPDFSGLSNLTLKFPENEYEYGSLPNLALNWETGTPFYLPIQNFAVEFSGQFYVDQDELDNSNKLNFYFAGKGISFDFEWNGSTVKTGTLLDTTKKEDYEIVTIDNPSSGWYPFIIHIWGNAGNNDGGFVALYDYSYIESTGNILYNGDVSDSTTNWSGNVYYNTSDYNSSPASIKIIEDTTSWFGDGYAFAHLKIPKALHYSKTYTIEFYAKLINVADTGSLSITLSSSTDQYVETLSDSWVKYSHTFIIDQKDVVDDFIHFTHNYTNGIYIDDVSLSLNNSYYDYNLTVLNAGVINTINRFLDPIDVKYVMDLSGSKEKNGYAKYQFTVPLGENGYVLNNDNDFEDFSTGNIVLSEGKLIKIYVGYLLDSTPTENETIGYIEDNKEYIPRATLFIDKFEVNRNKNIITVYCTDILNITEQQFCINYPNSTSYWAAGYVRSSDYTPDSKNFITAYDMWRLNKAVKDLLMNSGLPASLFNGKEYRHNSSNVVEEANYLILNKKNILEFNKDYGDTDYSKYNYYFDVGTRVHEALMKIVDVYGYILDTRFDGMVRVLESNNATFKFDGSSYLSAAVGTGGIITHYKAQSGNYLKLAGDGAKAKYSFKGNGFSVLFVRNINSGASHVNNYYWEGTPSVIIDVVDDNGNSVYTKDINLYYSDGERFYYDGIDYNIGDNPCIIQFTQGLKYDNYTMEIKVSGDYEIGVDQIWVYNYKYTNISKTFNTYEDDGTIGTVGTLNFDRGFDTFRNDILIVGKRNVFTVGSGDVDQTDMKSIYENIHSRDIDVNSIYNSFSSNYVGRSMMTYIQEPTISNYAQAKWLSYNILVQYRNKKMHPNFMIYGDPTVEIHDCVAINDRIIDSLGSNKFWINGYSETIKKDSWNIEYSLIGIQPFPSYESNTDYDISKFNGNYLTNFTITDINGRDRGNGYTSDLQQAIPSTQDKIYVDDASQYPSATGYVIIYSPDDSPFYGLFEYTSVDLTNNILIGSFIWKNISDFSTVDYTLFKCISGYNLYESEDFGNYIKISFICLAAGEIQIGVKKSGHSGYIAGLSGDGGLQADNDRSVLKPLTQKVYPGDEITVYWGGVDQTGISFEHDTEADDIAGSKGFLGDDGNYFIEVKYVNYKQNNTKIYMSNNYLLDESGNQTDGKYIYAIRSFTDSFDIDIDFARDITIEYTQGGTGGKMYVDVPYRSNNPSYTMTRYSTNYIYVSNDKKNIDYNDGDIIIKVKQLNIYNLSRKYWIKLKPTVYRFLGKKNPSKDEIQYFAIDTFEFNEDYFNDGTPILLSDSEFKEIVINPKTSKWGGTLDVDEDFVRFMNDKDLNDDTYYLAYFLLIGVEVIDASGRRCPYIGKNNTIAIWEDSDTNIFDKYNWNTVFEQGEIAVTLTTPLMVFDYPYVEFIWVPMAIDDPTTYGTTGYLINVNGSITMHRDFAFGGRPTNHLSEMYDDLKHHIFCEPKCDTDYLPFKVCKTK